MKGLLEEAAEDAEEIERGPILDAALIGGLQRVEHYEIAAYGTVIALAESMGQSEIQQLLEQTLDEEKDTDQILTTVAKTVNEEAIAGTKKMSMRKVQKKLPLRRSPERRTLPGSK